jgi:two-component system, chemotaxis family, CheB/CheR fusion protein
MEDDIMTNVTFDPELESLLDFIKVSRGYDFTGNKRTSLVRRLQKRMQAVGAANYGDYYSYLEVHPDEFNQLFNTILINVTEFFRDPKAWEYLNDEVLGDIIEKKRRQEPIRIWSAGCASGEETYSIVILLAEQLGIEQFKERVKLYSTDLDEEALARARQAAYEEKDLENVPHALVEKYFEFSGDRYVFNKELRRSVIFGRHDLVQDAPISRIDLLLCRNVLMYFNSETQTRILTRLNYALAENGYLFLGKAEMLLTHVNLFTPVNLKFRIFKKVSSLNLRDRMLVMAQNNGEDLHLQTAGQIRLRDAALDASPNAHLILDRDGFLVMANQKARELFNLTPRDLGQPFQDLEVSYRPVELRSSIQQAYSQNSPVALHEVEMFGGSNGNPLYLNILLTPLQITGDSSTGMSIVFTDVSEHKHLQTQLEHANQDLETAMEELQSTNEELETTNEELQSTIEELETTNEELQSTNEELETMNEELQSTNEELETMNDEISLRSEELNRTNAFLESILTGLRNGVVVLDTDMLVQAWNKKSEDMWGVRANEAVGHNFFSLDIGLPVEQLRKIILSVLSGEEYLADTILQATNRRGREIRIQVTSTPLSIASREIRGVILILEQLNNGTEQQDT